MGQIDESWLWNIRMGHMRFDNIVKVSKKKAVRGMPKIIKTSKKKSEFQDKGIFNIKSIGTCSC